MPYNQDIKVQVTTKNIKKEDRLYMKSITPEASCAKGVFQIQPSVGNRLVSTNKIIEFLKVWLYSTKRPYTGKT